MSDSVNSSRCRTAPIYFHRCAAASIDTRDPEAWILVMRTRWLVVSTLSTRGVNVDSKLVDVLQSRVERMEPRRKEESPIAARKDSRNCTSAALGRLTG